MVFADEHRTILTPLFTTLFLTHPFYSKNISFSTIASNACTHSVLHFSFGFCSDVYKTRSTKRKARNFDRTKNFRDEAEVFLIVVLLRCFWFDGNNVDVPSGTSKGGAGLALEGDDPGDRGEQGIVTPLHNTGSGTELGAALADDNCADFGIGAVRQFYSKPLTMGVAA
jgi:hypothetical protein